MGKSILQYLSAISASASTFFHTTGFKHDTRTELCLFSVNNKWLQSEDAVHKNPLLPPIPTSEKQLVSK